MLTRCDPRALIQLRLQLPCSFLQPQLPDSELRELDDGSLDCVAPRRALQLAEETDRRAKPVSLARCRYFPAE